MALSRDVGTMITPPLAMHGSIVLFAYELLVDASASLGRLARRQLVWRCSRNFIGFYWTGLDDDAASGYLRTCRDFL